VSSLFVVLPTSWRGAGWRFLNPGGRPGPGLPGFGALAGQGMRAAGIVVRPGGRILRKRERVHDRRRESDEQRRRADLRRRALVQRVLNLGGYLAVVRGRGGRERGFLRRRVLHGPGYRLRLWRWRSRTDGGGLEQRVVERRLTSRPAGPGVLAVPHLLRQSRELHGVHRQARLGDPRYATGRLSPPGQPACGARQACARTPPKLLLTALRRPCRYPGRQGRMAIHDGRS